MRSYLIEQLKCKLEERDFFEETYTYRSGDFKFSNYFLHILENVKNDSQIERMICVLEEEDFSSARDVLESFQYRKLLEIDPALVHSEDGSTGLMLKFNKFLHWFRSYGFRISSTSYGAGTYYTGADRLDIALRSLTPLTFKSMKQYSDASKFICIAGLIPVLLYHNSGVRVFNANRQLVDEYVQSIGSVIGINESMRLDDFMKYVNVSVTEEASIIPDGCILRVVIDGSILAVISYSEEQITCIFKEDSGVCRSVSMCIPEWVFVKNDYGDRCIKDVRLLYVIAARAVVSLCGFVADSVSIYRNCSFDERALPLSISIGKKVSSWVEIEECLESSILGEGNES